MGRERPAGSRQDRAEDQTDATADNGNRPRVGLVGIGGFGRHHLAALRRLEAEGRCQLVAVCDSASRGGQADHRLFDDLTYYHRLEVLLDAERIDHVVLSTPPHLHGEQACAVLERGLSLYLEKPPVTTMDDLTRLMAYREARISVGFQFLEAEAFLTLKRILLRREHGTVRRLGAAGLWPRTTWYYRRSPWAGRMNYEGGWVFDGPLTNALAHLVHAVFFLLGPAMEDFARPAEIRGRLLRARPIEGYDFGRLAGVTPEGIDFEIAAAHCATEAVPWTIWAEMEDGNRFVIEETQIPSPSGELLVASHRRALQSLGGAIRVRSALSDCYSYVRATAAALESAGGIDPVAGEVVLRGTGESGIFHAPDVLHFVAEAVRNGTFSDTAPAWMKLGDRVRCEDPCSS